MTGFDLSTISSVYVGNTQYNEIYLGSTKIWSSSPDYSREYFTIESLEDNNKITWHTTNFSKYISVSVDNGTTWTTYESLSVGRTIATLNTGEKVLIKGSNTYYGTSQYYNYFNSSKNCNIYGNIMSLIYSDNFIGQTTLSEAYTFYGIFEYLSVISAEHLILPATTLSSRCYMNMFQYCTSLTTAPELPATTLAEGCYTQMFFGCSSLTTAPELSATTLSQGCYWCMFSECTSLTTASELPATILAHSCYYAMFSGCTSLNSVTCHATDISAYSCLYGWLNNVASTGDFYKDANTTYPTGTSGIPSGWTIHNIN